MHVQVIWQSGKIYWLWKTPYSFPFFSYLFLPTSFHIFFKLFPLSFSPFFLFSLCIFSLIFSFVYRSFDNHAESTHCEVHGFDPSGDAILIMMIMISCIFYIHLYLSSIIFTIRFDNDNNNDDNNDDKKNSNNNDSNDGFDPSGIYN